MSIQVEDLIKTLSPQKGLKRLINKKKNNLLSPKNKQETKLKCPLKLKLSLYLMLKFISQFKI
jgi:hypothetical protein